MPNRVLLGVAVLVFCLAVTPALAQEFDHTHTRWTLILQKAVKDGRIDYVSLVRDPSELEKYIKELGRVKKKDFEGFSINQKIAYWCNFYNAATVLAISGNYPVISKEPDSLYPRNSVRQIPGIWNKMRFKTALGMKTLSQIEAQEIESFKNPLVYFLVVNSAVGGPEIMDQAVHPDRMEEQINESVRNFVLDAENVRADPGNQTLWVSEMFKWKAAAFIPRYYKLGHFQHRTKEEIAVLNFLNQYAGMMEKMLILKDDFQIRYIKYDWSLNER